ncbi:MAG: thiamine-phosphate synthase family protein [Fervidobacterium sp.]
MVMVISGFDPSAGAGILQDIKSLSLLGISATAVVSTYTVQNTERVFSVTFRKWEDIDRELSVLEKPKYVKIGLITPEFVKLVREKYPETTIVWNIILSSSSGYFFEAEEEVLRNLIYADYVILNNQEAEKLKLKPSEKCIITCGHKEGDDVKVLYKDKEFSAKRIHKRFHGTGCAFSSLVTGFLSFGYQVEEAILSSMEIMEKILSLSKKEQVESEKLAREWMKIDALEKLEKIIPEIEKIGHKTVPEVGQNVSYALPWSTTEEEVAKFPGRIRLKEGKPFFASSPSFKDKSHTARMSIAAKEFAPHVRCVTNVKYEKQYIDNAIKNGLKVFKYDRASEPIEISNHDGKSMQWMIQQAVKTIGSLPDIIYDEGWYGKEAMIRIFGRNPQEVMQKVLKIIKDSNKDY